MKIFDDKLIIITGGAGFLGSGVVRHLNDLGLHNLIIVDNLGHGQKWKNLVSKDFYDIIPTERLLQWLQGRESDIEAFIHCGTCCHSEEAGKGFPLESSYRFTVQLAEYAAKHEHRFIYASDATTYGDGSQGFSADHSQLKSLRPTSAHGYSKHLFDLWALNQELLDQFVGLKFFSVFGPNEYHKGPRTSLVSRLIHEAVHTGKMHLYRSTEPDKYADGEQAWDFIYLKDAARLTYAFLGNSQTGIFNVGRGVAVTHNQVAHSIIDALGRKIHIEYVEVPPHLAEGFQNYTCADISKLPSKEAHFTDFDAAIRELVNEYALAEVCW